MAEYGATLIDASGNIWSTPNTTPMCLVQKIELNPSSGGSIDLQVNSSSPFLVGCHGGSESTIFWLSRLNNLYRLNYAKALGVGSIGSVTIYIFGYVIPQPIPSFGIAIWNEQQQCILTNETKVMGAPTGYGDIGSTQNIGYLVDVSVAGKWAVIPKVSGLVTGIVNSGGGPATVTSSINTGAFFNGSNTRINSGQRTSLAGATSITFQNTRDQVFAIDVSRF